MAPAHPPASTTSATTPGGAASTAMSTAMRAARLAWINVVAMSSALRDRRSARTPPRGARNAIGTKAAAAMTAFQVAWRVTSAT